MGCGASSVDSQESQCSAKIDKTIRKEPPESNEVSLLLLGAGESGKSTIIKQMRIIHDEGFTLSQRVGYKPIVHSNTIQSLNSILQAMEKLELKFADINRLEDYKKFMDTIGNTNEHDITLGLGETMSRIWSDTGVQVCFLRSREYQLNDSAGFFLNSLCRISDPHYIPTEKDVLKTRVRTTGIVQTQFNYKNMLFKMYDVGGQRSHRKKWLYCFEDVTAIIFCTAISEYDLTLEEDEETNRMVESMSLFDSICNNKLFAKKSMVLFLNKTDLFREKIQSSPLTICFPDYDGQPGSHMEAIAFIKMKFQNLSKRPLTKEIYVHLTCAIDTENIQWVFDVATDVILKHLWNECSLY